MKTIKLIFTISILFIAAQVTLAQGEIVTKAYADQNYGKVVKSIPITRATLQGYLAKSNGRILFSFNKENIVFANSTKQILSPSLSSVDATSITTFKVASTTILNLFLSKTKDDVFYFEERVTDSGKKYTTISTGPEGAWVFEGIATCPPYCN